MTSYFQEKKKDIEENVIGKKCDISAGTQTNVLKRWWRDVKLANYKTVTVTVVQVSGQA